MRRSWVAAVVLAACGPSDRERDCAEVRAILLAPNPTDVPRRYWSYDPVKQGSAAIFDPSPFEKLKKLDYRDDEVRKAVLAYVAETGWTFYTPYSAEADTSSSREQLAKLCGLPRITVEAR